MVGIMTYPHGYISFGERKDLLLTSDGQLWERLRPDPGWYSIEQVSPETMEDWLNSSGTWQRIEPCTVAVYLEDFDTFTNTLHAWCKTAAFKRAVLQATADAKDGQPFIVEVGVEHIWTVTQMYYENTPTSGISLVVPPVSEETAKFLDAHQWDFETVDIREDLEQIELDMQDNLFRIFSIMVEGTR